MRLQWLSDLRVLDMSQYLPGPFATRLLADMGADVVKVEPPGESPAATSTWRAGRVSPAGAQLGKSGNHPRPEIRRGTTRVIGTNRACRRAARSYRPGVLDRLGFGNEVLRQLNPSLVHCALSGYGQTGPARHASGHDINYQAITGGLNQCGMPDRPVIPFPPMADYAGALQAVLTVLGALIGRGRNGGVASSMSAWRNRCCSGTRSRSTRRCGAARGC